MVVLLDSAAALLGDATIVEVRTDGPNVIVAVVHNRYLRTSMERSSSPDKVDTARVRGTGK